MPPGHGEHGKGPGHGEWTLLLSEYLDGTLPPDRAMRVDEHLGACSTCAAVLAELTEVVSRAKRLEDRDPPRDLWPSVREELARAPVIRLEPAADVPRRTPRSFARRRVTLSLAQLSLAASLVTLLAGGAAWALRPLAAGSGTAILAVSPSEGIATLADTGTDRSGGSELELLERTLAGERDRLSPHTVRILEKNLDLIDRAIREATDALAVDPENPFLEEHLRRAHERRAEYLREATALLDAAD